MQSNNIKQNINPSQYIYYAYQNDIQVNLIKADFFYRQYFKREKENILTQTLNITGHIAINTNLIPRSERNKNLSNRVQIGRNFYYIFKKDTIPLKIYLIIRDQEEKGKVIFD